MCVITLWRESQGSHETSGNGEGTHWRLWLRVRDREGVTFKLECEGCQVLTRRTLGKSAPVSRERKCTYPEVRITCSPGTDSQPAMGRLYYSGLDIVGGLEIYLSTRPIPSCFSSENTVTDGVDKGRPMCVRPHGCFLIPGTGPCSFHRLILSHPPSAPVSLHCCS